MNIPRILFAKLQCLLLLTLLSPLLSHAAVVTNTTFNGLASYFTPAGPGACQIPNGEFNNFFVAMDSSRNGNSAWCGAWLEVTGPGGTTQVQVIDRANTGDANNLDLSLDAFQAIGGSTMSGPIAVSWKWISAPGNIGPIKLYDGGSSNVWYLSIKPVNVVNPVIDVEVNNGGGWIPMNLGSGYYFDQTFGSPLVFPISVRVTDIFNNEVTTTVLSLSHLSSGQVGVENFPPIANGIVIEQPATVNVGDGGARDLGFSVDGNGSAVEFTIRNAGSGILNISGISSSGTNAADFTVTSPPVASIASGASETFEITFSSSVAGAKSAVITVTSDDPDPALASYQINVTGTAISSLNDTDADGLNDAAEVLMSDLGFDWTLQQTALVNTYYAGANKAGLFTPTQVQALHVNSHILQRDTVTEKFTLTLSLGKSSNLIDFSPFSFTLPEIDVNGSGELEFEFDLNDDTAFLRVGAE